MRAIIKACDDADLIGWDVSLYSNGSYLIHYYKRNGITAMVNVAEASVSGIFAFRDMYDPIMVTMDKIDEITDIFKKTEIYGK